MRPLRFGWWRLGLATCALAGASAAFEVLISEADNLKQTCSGMWAGKNTSIDLTFNEGSGAVATLFYEWADFPNLGIVSPEQGQYGIKQMVYICTTKAVQEKLCNKTDLGSWITKPNATSIQQQTLRFPQDGPFPKTINYPVKQKGYFCVASVPMATDGSAHSTFKGVVKFNNIFKGSLRASEWPRLNFYLSLTSVYVILGGVWFFLCVKHRQELLMVQHFISGTIAFLIVEMGVQWAYQAYLNSHSVDYWHMSSLTGDKSVTSVTRFLLVLSSVLDAARNSISFFLLLIVSMGYGVVRPTIGPIMTRVRILTAVHFVFGVLYSVGIALLLIEEGGGWVFFFIFPLSFTLTAFMSWTLHSLNGTIQRLTARKQTFKRNMFQKLYRILLGAVILIFVFFVVSSFAFSQSGSDSFAPRSWPYRWFLLDGWLGLLYFFVFASIAWIWRPTGQNLRLSMSDEIATDEDAEVDDFEIDTFAQRDPADEEDVDLEQGRKRSALARSEEQQRQQEQEQLQQGHSQALSRQQGQGYRPPADSEVMFSIGEDDGPTPRTASMRPRGTAAEHEGLMDGREDDEEDEGKKA